MACVKKAAPWYQRCVRLQTVMGLVVVMVMGVARADHTAADARATTAKLEAIRRAAYAPPAPKTKKAPPKAEAKHEATARRSETPAAKHKESDADPMWSMIGHAMAIPFDAKEREAHFRDIPTTPAEIDAHLRRLDAALAAKHQHR
jgi:hypothetical protein